VSRAAEGVRATGLAGGALVLTLLVAAGALALGGYPPVPAGTALVRGAVGSGDALLSVTLVRAVPLILTGLAVALAFRGGVWNIGAEGQLYAGALVGTAAGLAAPGPPAPWHAPLVLGAAALGGALWAALPALLRVRRGVGEVITTLVLNFVALNLVSWVVRGPLQEPRRVFPQSAPIAEAARLAPLWEGTRLHWGFPIAVALAVLLWWVLGRTAVGFRLRAVGASPSAARVGGRIPVAPLTLGTFLASGSLAGLAGGVEVAGVTYALYEGLSPGHGYTAIAVALLARLNPLGVVAAGALFGGLEGGAGAMQRSVGVPAAWVRLVEALVILSVLAIGRAARHGPARTAEPAGDPAHTPAAA
jgi:simple sugar transport system permease protein